MSDLPRGWARASVSEVAASMFDGPFGSALKTADYTESGVRVARLENIGHLHFRSELASYISHEKYKTLERHTLRANDVLFSSFVDQQTRVCLVPAELDGRMINKADCFCVRLDPRVCEPQFLAYFLASPASYKAFAGAVRGVTRPRIGLRDLAAFEIDLPPLAEQRRIVARLDALTARTGRARADLDRIPALAARYKQAVLAKAFAGVLTRSERAMTDEHTTELPAGWVMRSLGDLCDIQSGIALGKRRAVGTQMLLRPYLRVANVQRGWLNLSEIKQVKVTPEEFARLKLQDGDILMNEGGDLNKLGRGWVWRNEVPDCVHQNHVFRLRLKDAEFPPEFISHYANEQGQKYFLDTGKQTTNLASISKSKVAALPVPVPSAEEAQKIVRRIDTAFVEIDRLVAEAASARKHLDRLDQAILVKAFRSELVQRDPTDEPAGLLLSRIRAERASAPKVRRGRHPSHSTTAKRSSMPKSRLDEDVKGRPFLASILKGASAGLPASDLFKSSNLPIADFYKQLAWELDQGLVKERGETLEAV